jgi:glycosyltransferase involved in cell wall biosynthesis
VVICTFDNARLLDLVLDGLAAQAGVAARWSVLVVDNNGGDDTAQVVERHRRRGAIPGLRRVEEHVQGLTPARRRGVAATSAPWIAFVDDDCVVDGDWIRHALAFAAAHPGSGGFGGRVVPVHAEGASALAGRFGWAFAEQDLGDDPVVVDCLVGAGMVLNRAALEASGWPAGPFFADRVGRKLVSGGDVEIALRVAATGHPLWYVPSCRIHHLIPAHRTTLRYLARLTKGLGVAASLADALTWPRSRRAWLRAQPGELANGVAPVLRAAGRRLWRRQGGGDAVLAASYEAGRWIGVARVVRQLAGGGCDFFGQARGRVVRTG